jgi:hypothetical protein
MESSDQSESALRDKTRDLFGQLFVPYDYTFEFELVGAIVDKDEKIESSTSLSTFVPEPWYFALSVRKDQFQYSYPREKDPSKAKVFIATYRAQVRQNLFRFLTGCWCQAIFNNRNNKKLHKILILRFLFDSTRQLKIF